MRYNVNMKRVNGFFGYRRPCDKRNYTVAYRGTDGRVTRRGSTPREAAAKGAENLLWKARNSKNAPPMQFGSQKGGAWFMDTIHPSIVGACSFVAKAATTANFPARLCASSPSFDSNGGWHEKWQHPQMLGHFSVTAIFVFNPVLGLNTPAAAFA